MSGLLRRLYLILEIVALVGMAWAVTAAQYDRAAWLVGVAILSHLFVEEER